MQGHTKFQTLTAQHLRVITPSRNHPYTHAHAKHVYHKSVRQTQTLFCRNGACAAAATRPTRLLALLKAVGSTPRSERSEVIPER